MRDLMNDHLQYVTGVLLAKICQVPKKPDFDLFRTI